MLSFEELYALVREKLSPKRVLHVLGVEQEAIVLAQRWDVDVQSARQAALLHDITKEVSDQLKLCEECGIMADIWQRGNEKLLHSLTGAFFAERCGASAEVVQAIRWHTTARPQMTRLEQVLYLADFVEPTRKPMKGLDQLRALIYEDLPAAMLKGIVISLSHLLKQGSVIHPDSWRAQLYYLEQSHARSGLSGNEKS